MRRLSTLLALVTTLGGCVDTSGAWNLQDAARVFDATPAPQGQIEPGSQPASDQQVAVIEPRAPLFPDAQAAPQPIETDPAAALSASNTPQAILDLEADCTALPQSSEGGAVLLVLAMQEASPDAASLFTARAAYQRLVACYADQGLVVQQETRLGQSQLSQPAQILVY